MADVDDSHFPITIARNIVASFKVYVAMRLC